MALSPAIIIGSSQLGKLLGVKLPRSSYVFVTIGDALSRLGDVHLLTLLLAVINIAVFVAIAKGKAAALSRLDEANPANHTKRVLVASTPAALIVRACRAPPPLPASLHTLRLCV